MSYETITDVNGEYSITVPLGKYNLAVSNIGYIPYEATIEFGTEGEYTLDIPLVKEGEGMEHTWEESRIITAPKIVGKTTTVGTPEINCEQLTVASITNNRETAISGLVTITLLKGVVVINALETDLSVTIFTTESWSKTYIWTPIEEAEYTIRMTFKEMG